MSKKNQCAVNEAADAVKAVEAVQVRWDGFSYMLEHLIEHWEECVDALEEQAKEEQVWEANEEFVNEQRQFLEGWKQQYCE